MKKYISKSSGLLSNKHLLKEIKKRTVEMENGTAQTYTWAAVQQRAELSLAKARASQK